MGAHVGDSKHIGSAMPLISGRCYWTKKMMRSSECFLPVGMDFEPQKKLNTRVSIIGFSFGAG